MNIAERIALLFSTAKQQKTSEETLTDAQGRVCPIGIYTEVQIARDRLVKQSIAEAKKRANEQQLYHQDMIASISEFFRLSAEEHHAKPLGEESGVDMVSIDGLMRIKLVRAKSATANEKLMIAKAMLEELVAKRGANIEPFFKTLVFAAFETSATGQMRLDKVIELRGMKCEYHEWRSIKEALDAAIEYVFKKRYVVFYERESAKDSWKQIPLNLHNN